MAVAVREINGNVSMTDPVHGRQTFTLTRAGARHPVKSVTQRGIRPRDFLRLAVRRYFADLHARATQQLADLQARAAAMSMAMNAEASANAAIGNSPSNDAPDINLNSSVEEPPCIDYYPYL